MATATLLLPERARFASQRLPADLAQWLGRADKLGAQESRPDAADANVSDAARAIGQRARVFDILPRGWPVAAATRQCDVGDASLASWLRADPAYVRPDINGARLLAYGRALSLTAEDCADLLRPLRPLFGDAGFPIDAPVPSRWYLRLPKDTRLPTFANPEDALGADMFEHLPGADATTGDDGRRWRALLSEAQVVLHNHPRNAARIAAGLPPVNSLWFWGAGALPDHVRSRFTMLHTDDEAMAAFARLAKAATAPLPAGWSPVGLGDAVASSAAEAGAGTPGIAFDLRRIRDLTELQATWLAPLTADLRAGRLTSATLDFADGVALRLTANQRWRFWRRPLNALDA